MDSPKLKRNSDVYGNFVDRRADALYDRVRFKAGTITPSVFPCFEVPVGRNDAFNPLRVKSFLDTNMCDAGQLAPPHEMIVQRVLFLFQPSTLEPDRNNFLSRYRWEFRILCKAFASEPVLMNACIGRPEDLIENWGKACWLEANSLPENHSTSRIDRLGQGLCWDLKDSPRLIPPLCPFKVTLEGEPFSLIYDLDFYVFLDGYRDFAVE